MINDPLVIIKRFIYLSVGIFLLQLFHYIVFLNPNEGDVKLIFIINSTIIFPLLALKFLLRNRKQKNIFFNWKYIFIFFIIAFIAKLLTRIDYIFLTINEGLRYSREEGSTGGNFLTYFSVFFFPLYFILLFSNVSNQKKKIGIFLAIFLSFIDAIFIGGRNTPFFIIIFTIILVMKPIKINFLNLIKFFLFISLMLVVFNYSSIYRSKYDFDYSGHMSSTVSTQVVKVDDEYIYNKPQLLPLIFFTHYISHSISELNYFLSLNNNLNVTFANTLVQICAAKICNRENAISKVESINDRTNVYQTIWASLILDFSFLGAIIIYVISIIYIYYCFLNSNFTISTYYLIFIVSLGAIENYFFLGLGLIQPLIIFLLSNLLRKYRYA